jgi:hypothetical protein
VASAGQRALRGTGERAGAAATDAIGLLDESGVLVASDRVVVLPASHQLPGLLAGVGWIVGGDLGRPASDHGVTAPAPRCADQRERQHSRDHAPQHRRTHGSSVLHSLSVVGDTNDSPLVQVSDLDEERVRPSCE